MTTRGEGIRQRFQIGKTVFVGNTVPPKTEWPGVAVDMNQFFCGEELKILGIVAHPDDPDRVALELDTKQHGCKRNHLFSVEWVSLADQELPQITLAHSVRRTRKSSASSDRVQEIRDYLKAADSKLEEIQAEKITRVAKLVHTARKEATPEVKAQVEQLFEEAAAEVAAEQTAAQAPTKSNEIGWGTAIGGALVGAFATAWAQSQMKKRIGKEAPPPFLQIEPEPVQEAVRQMVAVPEPVLVSK